MAGTSLARTIARNTLFVTLGSLSLKVINTAYQIYIVRSLGDERFGRFSVAVAWVGLFSIFAELGVTQFAMRESARDPSRTRWLFWNVAALRGVLALVGVAGISAGAAAVGYSQDIVLAVLLYSCTFLIAALASPLEAVLTARERFGDVTLLSVLGQICSAALGTLVLLNDWGIAALAAVGILAMLPPLALAVLFVRRGGERLTPPLIDPRGWRALIGGGLPFGLITLALTIAFGIDTVMLSWFVPDAEVGWYNVAYGFSSSLLFVFSGFSEAMVPSLTRAHESDPAEVRVWYTRSLRVIVFTGLPIAAGAAMLAEPLLRLLYGPTYAAAAPALRIIAWDVPLLMYTSFCGNMATVTGAERAAARIYIVNALANVALNAVAIPFAGMLGAAAVTVATDLIGGLQFHVHFRRAFAPPEVTRLIWRAGAATGVMCLALAGIGQIAANTPVIVLAVLGALVYGACSVGFGVFDSVEKGALRSIATRLAAVLRPSTRRP